MYACACPRTSQQVDESESPSDEERSAALLCYRSTPFIRCSGRRAPLALLALEPAPKSTAAPRPWDHRATQCVPRAFVPSIKCMQLYKSSSSPQRNSSSGFPPPRPSQNRPPPRRCGTSNQSRRPPPTNAMPAPGALVVVLFGASSRGRGLLSPNPSESVGPRFCESGSRGPGPDWPIMRASTARRRIGASAD